MSKGRWGQQVRGRGPRCRQGRSRTSTQPGASCPAESAPGLGRRPAQRWSLPHRSCTWSGAAEGRRHYLEPTEAGVEVVEGQDAVVDRQEAEEPGGADQ